jgi:hypothetical protein
MCPIPAQWNFPLADGRLCIVTPTGMVRVVEARASEGEREGARLAFPLGLMEPIPIEDWCKDLDYSDREKALVSIMGLTAAWWRRHIKYNLTIPQGDDNPHTRVSLRQQIDLEPPVEVVDYAVPGAERWFEFKRIQEVIERSTVQLTEQQRSIMDSYAAQSVAHIVGHDNFMANPQYFTQLAGASHIYPFTNCAIPRRVGRCAVISLFAAVCALVAPNVRIVILCHGVRATDALLEETKGRISAYPPAEKFVTANNARKLELTMAPEDIRRVCFFAGGVPPTARVGMGILVVDDLAAVDLAYYMESILPLATCPRTTILSMSVLNGNDAHAAEFLRQKNDTNKIFNVLEYSVPCKECKLSEEGAECQHFETSSWKSEARQRLLEHLAADVPTMHAQQWGKIANLEEHAQIPIDCSEQGVILPFITVYSDEGAPSSMTEAD